MIINQPPMQGTFEDFKRYTQETQQILNGMLELSDNIGGEYIDVSFILGVNQVIPHHLETVPYGFNVMYKYGPGHIFRVVGTQWDNSAITLTCDATLDARIFLFGKKRR